MNNVRATVLIIDDEPLVLEMFAYVLRESGFRVKAALSAEEGLSILGSSQVDALISDIYLAALDGFDVAKVAREQQPDLPILLVTGRPDRCDELRARSEGYGYLSKPMDLSSFVSEAQALLPHVDFRQRVRLRRAIKRKLPERANALRRTVTA